MKIRAALLVFLFSFVNSHTVEVDIDEEVRYLQQDREVPLSELESHNSYDVGVWVALEGIVYDLSAFTHPGGANKLLLAAGTEADDLYNSVSTNNHYLSIQNVVSFNGIVRVGPLATSSPTSSSVAPVATKAPAAPVAPSAPVASNTPVAPVATNAPAVPNAGTNSPGTSPAPQSIAPVTSGGTTPTPIAFNFTTNAPASNAPVVGGKETQSPAAAPPSSTTTSRPTSGGFSAYGRTMQVVMNVLTIASAIYLLR